MQTTPTGVPIVDEFRSIFLLPRYVGLRMSGRLTRERHVASFACHDAVPRAVVHDVGRNCVVFGALRVGIIDTICDCDSSSAPNSGMGINAIGAESPILFFAGF